jgi:carbon monoxide dehydrogenase subunit G
VIAAPADRAWEMIGRPERLGEWLPGVTECSYADGVRRLTLRSGITFEEHIVTNDALARRFQYRVVGGIFTEHLATVDVIELDADHCVVTYATDADPAPMAIVLGGAIGAGLEELRRQLEGATL